MYTDYLQLFLHCLYSFVVETDVKYKLLILINLSCLAISKAEVVETHCLCYGGMDNIRDSSICSST